MTDDARYLLSPLELELEHVRDDLHLGFLKVLGCGIGCTVKSGGYVLVSRLSWLLVVSKIERGQQRRSLAIAQSGDGRQHGAAYEEYCERVPRWIPQLRSTNDGSLD
ncbi:hypothetical protein [Halocatena marina]|uniref:hypothetical protein n=1 Tax=Halocatena marina TaxID=2934937 RepID=UPI004039E0B6